MLPKLPPLVFDALCYPLGGPHHSRNHGAVVSAESPGVSSPGHATQPLAAWRREQRAAGPPGSPGRISGAEDPSARYSGRQTALSACPRWAVVTGADQAHQPLWTAAHAGAFEPRPARALTPADQERKCHTTDHVSSWVWRGQGEDGSGVEWSASVVEVQCTGRGVHHPP
jgi:hypothetical protein